MSVNSLLTQTNKGWSNLHINSMKIYDSLTVDGSTTMSGDLEVNDLQANNIVSRQYTPTLRADQAPITRNRDTDAEVTFSGTIFPAGTVLQTVRMSRVGRSVTFEIDKLETVPGGTASIITANLSAYPGFESDYKPRNDVVGTVVVNSNNVSVGFILLKKSGEVEIYYDISGADFPAPTGVNKAGWANSIGLTYIADAE